MSNGTPGDISAEKTVRERVKQNIFQSEDLQFMKERLAEFERVRDETKNALRPLRRNLLIAGFIALLIGRTNLVPSKIEALGVEFSSAQQTNFRYFVGIVVVYLALAFSKEIVVQMYNTRKHRLAIDDLERYRRLYASFLSVSQIDELKASYGDLFESISVFIVDYVIPYWIALVGVTACYQLLPAKFYAF